MRIDEVRVDSGMVSRKGDDSTLNCEKNVSIDTDLKHDSGSKSWAELFANNWLKEKGSELRLVTPTVSNGKKMVRFHSAEVVQEEEKWKNSLVGCVYGL